MHKERRQPSATIIFDFDGTLANSVELIMDLYNSHAAVFGYEPITREEIPEIRRLGYKQAMKRKRIRYRMVPKIIMTLGKEMRTRMDEVKPYEGIVPLLHNLQKQGYTLGVLTSNQTPLVTQFFTEHGFPVFDFIVSEKTLFGKGKALKKIIRRFGLTRESILYVGDEPRDVVASRKAGVKVIGVSWGLGGSEGFEATLPDEVAHTPKELEKAVIHLSQA